MLPSTSLVSMNEESFKKYLQTAIPEYAKDNIESGRWNESTALEQSRTSYQKLLPKGADTENNYLFEITEQSNDETVGHIWVAIDADSGFTSAFIYDIEVFQGHRRKGYARSALRNIEEFVSELGVNSLGLHVFKKNPAAISLYKSIGFETASINMQKKLSSRDHQ